MRLAMAPLLFVTAVVIWPRSERRRAHRLQLGRGWCLRYRDALARIKDVLQLYVLKSKPTFLGPAIPITGDGRATDDR